jgi:hypothetical protein
MKIPPVGAEMFDADGRTDGWTDMTKLIVAFRNFVNAPKKSILIHHRKEPKYEISNANDQLPYLHGLLSGYPVHKQQLTH